MKNRKKFILLMLLLILVLPTVVNGTGELELKTNIESVKNSSKVTIPLKVNGRKDGLNLVKLTAYDGSNKEILSTSIKNKDMRDISFELRIPKEAAKLTIVGLDKSNSICSNKINIFTDNIGITNRREKIVSVIDEYRKVSLNSEALFPEWINVKTNKGKVRTVPVKNICKIDTSTEGVYEYSIEIPSSDLKGTYKVEVTNRKDISDQDIIEFKDPNLDKAVRALIGKVSGDILKEDVKNVKRFRPIEFGALEIRDLSGIEHFESLEILDIDLMRVRDLSPVNELHKLRWLYAYGNDINELQSGIFNNLSNLEQLGLGNCGLSYIREGDLEGLTNLDYLDLEQNDLIEVTGLSSLTKLRSLHLEDNRITDKASIKTISSLSNLKVLDMDGNGLTSLGELSGLKNLEWLKVNRNFLKDLKGIETLRNLEKLEFSNNKINDISGLKDLVRLKEIKGNINEISSIDDLANLKELNSIEFFKNNIADIKGLSGLTNLKKIDLKNNNISDLKPLENLRGLTHLWLTYNNIEDVYPLRDLENLYLLKIKEGNKIGDFSELVKIYYILRHKDFTI